MIEINMKKLPILKTERLILRPFTLDDASEVQKLAGDKDIASTTLLIPHPYGDGEAEKWIETHKPRFKEGKLVNFAITHKNDGYLIGAIGLNIAKQHESGELGYWVGKPYWNNGYCTESARAIIRFGFEELK